MDDAEQRAGEARVKELFIQRMEALGFMKPAGMKLDQYRVMQKEICQKLAYMTDEGLRALAEVMQGQGGGKSGDRFPIAAKVLAEANRIEQPAADASPLIRKVFASQVGADALQEGFAPELLHWLRSNRRWPNSYVLSVMRTEARPGVTRWQDLQRREGRGEQLTAEEAGWCRRRRDVVERCKNARRLGLGDAA